MKVLKRAPIHPFLLSAFPVLAMLAHNLGEMVMDEALRALLFALAASFILLSLAYLIVRQWQRAALWSSLFLLLFFSYGHIYEALDTVRVFGILLGRHRHLVPVWLLIFGVGTWWILKHTRDVSRWTEALNVFGLIAVALALMQIATFQYQAFSSSRTFNQNPPFEISAEHTAGTYAPDVYYIILDAYAREDALQQFYLYDNSDFIERLSEMGFFVASMSQSNYGQTGLSLASSLNMDYLDQLGNKFIPGNTKKWDLWPLIRDSRVRNIFEDLGYQIITFETGVPITDIVDSDYYFRPDLKSIRKMQAYNRLNGFEAMLIQTTGGMILTDAADVLPDLLVPDVDDPYDAHRERILSMLDYLSVIPSMEGPKFVFAHILCPHSPMVFGPNGEYITPGEPFTLASDVEANEAFKYRERIQGYRHQVTYINTRILEFVSEIPIKSERPPIIILQGDHGGPHSGIPREARLLIFNAYYLPGDGAEQLYDSISPVNTFRVIFNTYFNGDYELLEDIAYYSEYDEPFEYTIIPNRAYGEESSSSNE
jgi:hypothetical protein